MTLPRAFAFAALLLSAPIAVASETSITVTGPWITLGDVADASGPLAEIRVAPSPAPGEMLALDPGFVGKVARANGVYFPESHDGPIRVIRASAATAGAPTARSPAPAAVVADDQPPDADHILVLARDLARGDILTADDLLWEPLRPGQRRPAGLPAAKSDAVGRATRRAMRAGLSFRTADIETPAIIAKDEPVTLVYAVGGLRLSVSGRALTNAALGEPVRVMNNYSRRAIDAIASGAGEAQVPSSQDFRP